MTVTSITKSNIKMASSSMIAMMVLLLCSAPLVRTAAFTTHVISFPRGGSDATISRGGARLHELTSRRNKQQWRLRQSTAAALPFPADNSTEASSVSPPRAAETVTQMTASLVEEEDDEDNKPFLRRIDGIVFMSYLANVMALSLPVLLVPIAATESVATAGVSAKVASAMVASQAARISSVASLGGAVGKFVNGFICKELGSYFCSTTYLAGLGLCSLAFSVSQSPQIMSLAFAGMEFFASIQWASLAVMLSNYYAKKPVKLAAALTALGLSSSSGQILAKTLGMTLSTSMHWRQVAQLGALVAFGGAAMISRAPGRQEAAQQQALKPPFEWSSVAISLRVVLGSPLFWCLGLAHTMAFVAKNTDRILGTFFHEMAGLSQAICGGMTLSITLGLVHGLISGAKRFSKCANLADKRAFLRKRYVASVAATFGLVALSKIGAAGVITNKFLLSAMVAGTSFLAASNISFQYFQFPAMIAQKFGDHKAVVISFLDGYGFFLSAPIFAAMSQVVPTQGWSAGWTLLGSLFGAGALLMMSSINPILNLSVTPAEKELQEATASSTVSTDLPQEATSAAAAA